MAKNPTVLLVDQDPISRAEMHRMLALSGFAVLGESGHGIEAVSLAREVQPDIIVMAMEEPIVRPLQTIEAIVDALPHIPIIIYSSINDTATIRRAIRAGVRDFLVVPLKGEEVAQALSAILEQEERKRLRMAGQAEATAACGTIITIFGAKGGIGKTTIATNVGTGLAQRTGQSVVLVDLDTRFGDVAIMMDIPAEHSIADLAIAEDQIDRETVRQALYQHPSGVTVLPAPPRPEEWRNLTPSHIERIIPTLAEMFDYVVVDTPGTFNEVISKALELSTMVLLVTTVDMASLKDTLLTLDMMEAWAFPPEKVKVMVNHANASNTITQEDVKRTLGRQMFWELPYDRTVSTSTQIGRPVVLTKPQARVSQSLIALVHTLSGVGRSPKPKSGWRRWLSYLPLRDS
ncbi:MAG: CpaE family protein [Dehalococcoidia bacterium]